MKTAMSSTSTAARLIHRCRHSHGFMKSAPVSPQFEHDGMFSVQREDQPSLFTAIGVGSIERPELAVDPEIRSLLETSHQDAVRPVEPALQVKCHLARDLVLVGERAGGMDQHSIRR